MGVDGAGLRLVGTIVRWISFATLFTLLSLYVLRRPLELRAPATVLSNSHPVQRGSEPYLLFLREVARSVPGGATVAVVGADEVDSLGYMALGQLPRQRLLPPASLVRAPKGRRRPPAFVARYGGPFHDERYRLRDRFPTGSLYEARR